MIAELSDNPLKWWSMRKVQYVHLIKVVKKYLCMPATSVRSEEVFSTSGNVLTHKRNRVLPENVNQLVFLHKILWIEHFIINSLSYLRMYVSSYVI